MFYQLQDCVSEGSIVPVFKNQDMKVGNVDGWSASCSD
jgi:hypothetical protein